MIKFRVCVCVCRGGEIDRKRRETEWEIGQGERETDRVRKTVR